MDNSAPVFNEAENAEETPKKSKFSAFLKTLPLRFYLLLGFTALMAICHFIATKSTAFANFWTDRIAAAGRFSLAKLTVLLPFSLIETILFCLPLILVWFLLYSYRRFREGKNARPFCVLVGALCLYYCLFVLTFACGYHTDRMDVRLGLERRDVSADELIQTAEILSAEVKKDAKEVAFTNTGFSAMPYDYDKMSELLCDAYDRVHETYPFIQSYGSRVKPVACSVAMSYCHVTGVYSSITGEANLNIDFPDYSLPYTAAHELAHQRGVSREDEANFIAFLVCMASDDPYIRYSGALGMLEYTLNAVYSAAPDRYAAVYTALSAEVRGELTAYANFFKKYEHATAAKINEAVNDTYLKLQGTEGTRSYGLAVDLCVAYYRTEVAK